MDSHSTQRWVPEMEEEYTEKKSTVRHIQALAHPLCKGGSPKWRKNIEKKIHCPVYTSMGSPSTPRWVPEIEEEYIEKNPRSGIYKRWLTLYAKLGPQNRVQGPIFVHSSCYLFTKVSPRHGGRYRGKSRDTLYHMHNIDSCSCFHTAEVRYMGLKWTWETLVETQLGTFRGWSMEDGGTKTGFFLYISFLHCPPPDP